MSEEQQHPIPYKPVIKRALAKYELEAVRNKLILRVARMVQRDEHSAKDANAMKDQGF